MATANSSSIKGDLSFKRPPMTGRTINATLSLRTKEGSLYKIFPPTSFTCYIICCTQAIACETEEIDAEGLGKYNINATPSVRGQYQLKVRIGGFEVDGSPFSFFVIPSPESRNNSQKIVSDLEFVNGITTDKNGQLIITELETNTITTYDIEGKKIKSFGSKGLKKGQFCNPQSVAVTNYGCIVVADYHRLQKLTPDGECVMSIGSNEEKQKEGLCHCSVPSKEGNGSLEFCGPAGIAIHPTTGQIYALDHNYIHVINENFTHSYSFEISKKDDYICHNDIALDSLGNIYVATSNYHGIDVYTSDGTHIKRFGRQLSGGKSINPAAITIDENNLIYVVEYFTKGVGVTGEYSISVYTTNGEFIGCVGNKENGTREFCCLRDITTDALGNIYVTDSGNGTIVKL